MPAEVVRIGTRGSTLALWQARWVADRLLAELPEHRVELVPVTTRGDVQPGPLTGAPGQIGFFTSEIEAALLEGRVDVAVHSLKDLPTEQEARLPVLAVPLRGDVADALVSREGGSLADLPEGARVGTSSPRRACLVRSRRTDLEVAPVRGNVDTRVKKVEAGEYDAMVLAAAGLERLDLGHLVSERFDPRLFPPAPGQGALAVQTGEVSRVVEDALRRMDDGDARRTTTAERTCLEELGGGCSRPIGAHARALGERLELVAFVGSEDGRRVVRAEAEGDEPEALGRAVAADLRRNGAGELLA